MVSEQRLLFSPIQCLELKWENNRQMKSLLCIPRFP
uniref:Uncharacterized protein n=1 Tax=Anguilla anguilla TaxID=7936 RepID=A0A0E9TBH4_ANGAN